MPLWPRSKPIKTLARLAPLRKDVIAIWRAPRARQSGIWQAHESIKAVMFATGLAPRGILLLTHPES